MPPLTFQLIFAALIVLVLPGATLLAWLPRSGRDPAADLPLALALSAALTALLGLAAFLGSRPVGMPAVRAFYAMCLLLLGLGLWRRRAFVPTLGQILSALALVLFAAWRLYQARDLALPAWVDPVHHVYVVERIQAAGGLPVTLGNELPVPFFYHYTFHLLAALFASLSGLPPAAAVLWLGQVISAGAALAVYPLARACWPCPRRAGLAVLLVAFAFHLPAYYLTWGRYTLLTGLLILPAAMAQWLVPPQIAARSPTMGPEVFSLPGLRGAARLAGFLAAHARETVLVLLVAGVALTHYLALALLGLWGLILVLADAIHNLCCRVPWRAALLRARALVLPAGLGGLLAAPWLWRVWLYGRRFAGFELNASLLPESGKAWAAALRTLGPGWYHPALYLLAAAGLLWALARPSGRFDRRLAVWTWMMVLLAAPGGLRLGPFRPDHLLIVLFLPAALWLAGGLVRAGDVLARIWNPWGGQALGALVSLALLFYGAADTRAVLNPATLLAVPADVRALDWVRSQLPASARFYINTALWQAGSYRGVDGGYWLLPQTGRATLLPPAMYGYGSRAYIQTINARARAASRLSACNDDFWSLVAEAGLTHAYIKEGSGALQPAALQNCAGVREIYSADGVHIYELRRANRPSSYVR